MNAKLRWLIYDEDGIIRVWILAAGFVAALAALVVISIARHSAQRPSVAAEVCVCGSPVMRKSPAPDPMTTYWMLRAMQMHSAQTTRK